MEVEEVDADANADADAAIVSITADVDFDADDIPWADVPDELPSLRLLRSVPGNE